MKFIKYISILLLLFVFVDANAQSEIKNRDAVFLKNGSVFRGQILEYTQGELLKLRISNESTIFIQDKQIRKIIQGEERRGKVRGKKEYAFKERGLYHVTAVHFAVGASAFNSDSVMDLGGHHISGFQFNRFLGVGLGIGMDYYYIGAAQRIMPIYAEVRGYLKDQNFSPMYSLATGYGFAFESEERNITDAQGGLMFYPALGFRTGGSASANYFFDFGVKIQKATFTYENWDRRVNKMTYNRFVLRTGIIF